VTLQWAGHSTLKVTAIAVTNPDGTTRFAPKPVHEPDSPVYTCQPTCSKEELLNIFLSSLPWSTKWFTLSDQEITHCHITQNFFAVLTKYHQWLLSWTNWMQSTPPFTFSKIYTSAANLSFLRILWENCVRILLHSFHATFSAHFISRDNLKVVITKVLCFPFACSLYCSCGLDHHFALSNLASRPNVHKWKRYTCWKPHFKKSAFVTLTEYQIFSAGSLNETFSTSFLRSGCTIHYFSTFLWIRSHHISIPCPTLFLRVGDWNGLPEGGFCCLSLLYCRHGFISPVSYLLPSFHCYSQRDYNEKNFLSPPPPTPAP